jgi:hypothetical protein
MPLGRSCRVRLRGRFRVGPVTAAAAECAPAPWAMPPALAAVMGLALALGACGLKTPPRPLTSVLPAPAEVHAWQREAQVIVAWRLPEPGLQERYHGLRGFELWVQSRPLLCVECPPSEPKRLSLPLSAPGLQRQGSLVFYPLPLAPDVGALGVQVLTRFGLGLGPPSEAARVERVGTIPLPALAWQWEGGSEGAGARSVLFYWRPARERIVQMIGTDAQPHERVQYYRANLYRRVPPAPWPPLALNDAPLETNHWVVPPLQAEFPPGATAEAYTLRFVDQFGNEGPASPEVLVPLSGRRP